MLAAILVAAHVFTGGAALPSAAQNVDVLYHTHAVSGSTVTVSGTIAIPKTPPPPGGWRVVSWAHGTTGNAPQCAPSHNHRPDGEQRMLDAWVAHGYVVAETDYEGNGLPGVHPYFVGDAAVHDVTDIVRAAREYDSRIGSRWVAMGHSEGGNAALFAAARAPAYAPDLQLVGAVSYAPGSHIMDVMQTAIRSPDRMLLLPLILEIVQGMSVYDPSLPLNSILSPKGQALLPQLAQRCLDDLANDAEFSLAPADSLFNPKADFMPLFRDLNANNSSLLKLDVPTLLLQGGADEVAAANVNSQLAYELRAQGSDVTYKSYPSANHGTILKVSLPDALSWVDTRFQH